MTSSSTPKSLARARTLVLPQMAAASSTLSSDIRRVVEYHWGWIDAEGNPTQGGGGKLMRGTLAILSSEAVGQPADRASSGAAAVEITHDFTLLHDDIMDLDHTRRGRPTAWTTFGSGAALCAGDALALLAQRVLLDDRSPRNIDALRLLGECTEIVIAGQVLDHAFESRTDVNIEEYIQMASMKTSALIGCAASVGALLADAPEAAVRALREFGCSLGLAFQVVDDWLGIWGNPEKVGKPIASDLRQRKSSLPIVFGSSSDSAAGRELRSLLDSDQPLDESQVEIGLDMLNSTGAEAATVALAKRELEKAYAALDRDLFEPSVREELYELAAFTVERQF